MDPDSVFGSPFQTPILNFLCLGVRDASISLRGAGVSHLEFDGIINVPPSLP